MGQSFAGDDDAVAGVDLDVDGDVLVPCDHRAIGEYALDALPQRLDLEGDVGSLDGGDMRLLGVNHREVFHDPIKVALASPLSAEETPFFKPDQFTGYLPLADPR